MIITVASSHVSLLYDMTACVICTYVYLCVRMSHFNAISHRDTELNCVFTLRRPTHSELFEIMSHVYLFSHVYVFLYLLNYITSLY